MPELPEVETIRRDLETIVSGRTIAKVSVSLPKMIRGGADSLQRRLKGRRVTGIDRRGKLLSFELDKGELYLLIHLKMTGQLIYVDARRTVGGGHGYPLIDELPNKYSHVIFTFDDGSELYFNDMRQFGYVDLVDAAALEAIIANYGVEPLSGAFTADLLYETVKSRTAPLKNLLLDQTKIAGLGNIYVDESCWRAGIRSSRRGRTVTRAESARLYRAIRQVLRQAITYRGTTFGDYRDGRGGEGNFVRKLKVYGRAGQPCRRCGTMLKRTTIGGRGTVYCPVCQK